MQSYGDIQTILVGHEQVRDDERGGRLSESAESCPAIGRLHDPVPRLFQHQSKDATDLLVVVNDENGARSHVEVFLDVVAASRAADTSATPKGRYR